MRATPRIHPFTHPLTRLYTYIRLKENFSVNVRINQSQREELGLVEQVSQ